MWNEAKPGAEDFVGKGDDDIREMKTDVRVWTEKEHYPLGHATTPGEHLPGIIDTPELAPDAVTAEKIASGVDVSGKGFNAALLEGHPWVDVKSTNAFGEWESKNPNTVYLADTDGFVCINVVPPADSTVKMSMVIYTDAANPPTTPVVRLISYNDQGGGGTCPVKKGHYWKYHHPYYSEWAQVRWLPASA